MAIVVIMSGHEPVGEGWGAPLGRAAEALALQRFIEGLTDPGGPRLLLLSGEAGIGKTVLWWWAIGQARRSGCTVLVARPASAMGLAFEGVGDLLADSLAHASQVSPGVRAALEAAIPLLNPDAERSEGALDAATVTRACVETVRVLAESGPVLVAVDDLPNLDDASSRVVQQLPRRLGHVGVAVLATSRKEWHSPAAARDAPGHSWWAEIPEILPVGPLPDSALAIAIAARRGQPLPRPVLRQVLKAARGNPMLAIELVRSLDRQEASIEIDGVAAIPATLRHLVAARIDDLPDRVRAVLEVVSETSTPTASLVDDVGAEASISAVEEAIDLGLIEATRGRLRVTHPLVASAIRAATSPARRREIHRRLAGASTHLEERALHLGMATAVPDRAVADLLMQASRLAWSRGAADAAASFAEHAVRVTPSDDPSRIDSVMAAADLAFEAGDARRSVELIEATLDDRRAPTGSASIGSAAPIAPVGPHRPALLLRLARAKGLTEGFRASAGILEQALSEQVTSPDPTDGPGRDVSRTPNTNPDGATVPTALRARILLELSSALTQFDVHAALPRCLQALDEARSTGDADLAAGATDALDSIRHLLAVPETLEQVNADVASVRRRSTHPPAEGLPPPQLLRRGLGVSMRLKSAGHLADAQVVLEELRDRIELEGGEGALPPVLLHLGEIACFRGRLAEADDLIARCQQVIDRSGQLGVAAQLAYLEAFAAALRGDQDEAAAAATTALDIADALQDGRHQARTARVLGQLCLARSDWQSAVQILMPAVHRARSCGFLEPGFLRLDIDAAEALTGCGDLVTAQELSRDLDDRARLPWARAAADHVRALVHAADGHLSEAAAEADSAIKGFTALGHPVDVCRALIVQAGISRRQRRRAASRALLERAEELLDRNAVTLWAPRIATELSQLSRVPAVSPGSLTASEVRLAEAVAQGMTNREVAGALQVSIKTVEAHLSHIFTKLGIRSRSELVGFMVRGTKGPDDRS